jgi:hypothetical protein
MGSFGEVEAFLVWRKIGAKADAYFAVTPADIWISVFNAARFGAFRLIFSPSWNKISSERIVSDSILDKIQNGGNPAIFDKGHVGQSTLAAVYETNLANSYQWDAVFEDGDFYKEGVGGQVMARAIATSGLLKR